MKILKTTMALGAAVTLASGAPLFAQDEESEGPATPHYEMTGTISGATIVGGVGDEIYGGSWNEAVTVTSGENVTEVTAQCIGMDQGDSSTFERHFVCTMTDGNGQSAALLYGCNVTEGKTNEMRCYGHLEGKEGNVKDHASLMTAYYSFNSDGTGKLVGSGQWYK